MRYSIQRAGAVLLLLAGCTAASFHHSFTGPPKPDPESGSLISRAEIPFSTGYFQQLIDHDHPGLGTFSQRYYWNSEFYAGPGSPIIFYSVGESPIDGYERYVSNHTFPGVAAQEVGGANIILEHRFWGESSPFAELTVTNLQYLNLNQTIQDQFYFARNVQLPFDQNRTSAPDKAPWIFSACSYPGALAAWTADFAPGTFWGYAASSAAVESRDDGWHYFEQVKMAMPQNCSADVAKAIDQIDEVLLGNDSGAKRALKSQFGMQDIQHDDDFAFALIMGPATWQGTLPSRGYGGLYRFCDYVENQWPGSNATRPGSNGIGGTKALEGYAKWFKEVWNPGWCAGYGYWTADNETACWDTYNTSSPMYTDLTPGNTFNRQYQWLQCDWPYPLNLARGQTDIVSRLLTTAWWDRQCALAFPREGNYTYGLARGLDANSFNNITGGWNNVHGKRRFWSAGEFDTWRFTSVESVDRPGGPLPSTPEHPTFVVPRGTHCPDQLTGDRDANEAVREVFDAEIELVKQWVREFYWEHGIPHGYKAH